MPSDIRKYFFKETSDEAHMGRNALAVKSANFLLNRFCHQAASKKLMDDIDGIFDRKIKNIIDLIEDFEDGVYDNYITGKQDDISSVSRVFQAKQLNEINEILCFGSSKDSQAKQLGGMNETPRLGLSKVSLARPNSEAVSTSLHIAPPRPRRVTAVPTQSYRGIPEHLDDPKSYSDGPNTAIVSISKFTQKPNEPRRKKVVFTPAVERPSNVNSSRSKWATTFTKPILNRRLRKDDDSEDDEQEDEGGNVPTASLTRKRKAIYNISSPKKRLHIDTIIPDSNSDDDYDHTGQHANDTNVRRFVAYIYTSNV